MATRATSTAVAVWGVTSVGAGDKSRGGWQLWGEGLKQRFRQARITVCSNTTSRPFGQRSEKFFTSCQHDVLLYFRKWLWSGGFHQGNENARMKLNYRSCCINLWQIAFSLRTTLQFLFRKTKRKGRNIFFWIQKRLLGPGMKTTCCGSPQEKCFFPRLLKSDKRLSNHLGPLLNKSNKLFSPHNSSVVLFWETCWPQQNTGNNVLLVNGTSPYVWL